MNSNRCALAGGFVSTLMAFALATASYASPLIEQSARVRGVNHISHESAPLAVTIRRDVAAPREHGSYVAPKPVYRDPFVGGHCYSRVLTQGQGTVVVGHKAYDTSSVRICG